MKPHEETWVLSLRSARYAAVGPNAEDLRRASLPIEFEALSIGNGGNGPQVALIPLDESSLERARLAAQAPAMARLLLRALEDERRWNGNAGPYEEQWPTPHARALITTLRDAGVIE